MTKFNIIPSHVTGKITIPPSKSNTLRALVFALMGKKTSHIRNYLNSPDTLAMIEAIRILGADVDICGDDIVIQGCGGDISRAENIIDAKNSGILLRFIGGLAGLSPTFTVITGDHSIRHSRPVKPLLDALKQLGAMAESMRMDDLAPIIVKGLIRPGKAVLCGEDSQPVSAILIATSFLKGRSDIYVEKAGEKPWIDLTLNWLRRLNIRVDNEDYAHYVVHGYGEYDGFDVTIPGDFSSAAFPIAAAIITDSELTVGNVDMEDCQGDKKIIEALISMGANIEIVDSKKEIVVKKGSRLHGKTLDINDFIDAISILAVVGCFAEGTTHIVNAAIARKKESDRIHAICTELKKMGACIEETQDGLIISNSVLHGAHLQSHADHRIAMSLAIAALGARGESTIYDVECTSKTFPTFAKDLRALGARIV